MSGIHEARAAHEPWIEEITGHESQQRRSELSRYKKGILLQNLKQTIDLLDYGADFSHLRRKEQPAQE
jgi:hypothetical protein